jgi:hypothetical protein
MAQEAAPASPIEMRVFRPAKLELLTPGIIMSNVIDQMNRPQGPIPQETNVSLQFAKAFKDASGEKLFLSDVPIEEEPTARRRSSHQSLPGTLEMFADYQSIQYLPLKWSTYQYGLKVRARMVGDDGRVSWEHKCYIKPFKEDPRFQLTKDAFDSEGRALRAVISAAAEHCAREIADKL